jgi:hypothetical protein
MLFASGRNMIRPVDRRHRIAKLNTSEHLIHLYLKAMLIDIAYPRFATQCLKSQRGKVLLRSLQQNIFAKHFEESTGGKVIDDESNTRSEV